MPAQEADVGGVLEPRTGEVVSRSAEDTDVSTVVVAEDGLTADADYALEDPRLEEVVRLVQATHPGATVDAIREYLRMLGDRREARRKLATSALNERLPDPKPATLGQRLGPTPETLAEMIVDALRHERR